MTHPFEHLWQTNDFNEWNDVYEKRMDEKYKKNTRNFSRTIVGKSVYEPNLYIIPRQRGGPSYKQVNLEKDEAEDIQFCPISKGYSMQDVSSFTVGPIVGEGLCVVNVAFSKEVTINHIDGSGYFDPNSKTYWKNTKKNKRHIEKIDANYISVEGKTYNTKKWLKTNKSLWFDEWNKQRKWIALHNVGNFHWHNSNTIAYCHKDKIIDFVTWKKECYVRPAYDMFQKDNNRVIIFLEYLFKEKKISLGLVHPKGRDGTKEIAITNEFIREIYDGPTMCCMPFVVAGYLLDVNV